MDTISSKRKHFVQLLCFALICGLVYHSWTQESGAKRPAKSSQKPTAQLTAPYQDKVFLIESQVTLFAVHSMQNEAKRSRNSDSAKKWAQVLTDTLSTSVRQVHPPLQAESPTVTDLQRQKLIFSEWLGLSKEKDQFCEHIQNHQNGDAAIDSILMTRCRKADESGAFSTPSEEELQLVEKRLGWFGKVFRSTVQQDQSYFTNEVFAPAKQSLFKFGKIFLIAGGAILLSGLCLIIVISKLARGKFTMSYSATTFERAYLLEIFTLYLLSMLLVPLALKMLVSSNPNLNILKANVIAISCLSLLAFWPLLWRKNRSMLESALGLHGSSWSKTLRDFLAGPFIYFAALSGLLIVMMIYALLLTALGVDPSSGAHPVVPIIAQAKSSSTIIYIFILAVIVAPFVEELMFRGAFYSWLRGHLGAGSSIAISSIIFAAVHPQGALGLIPLTCIGMVLAFLREWRSTLTSCMIAHGCFNGGTLLLALNLLR